MGFGPRGSHACLGDLLIGFRWRENLFTVPVFCFRANADQHRSQIDILCESHFLTMFNQIILIDANDIDPKNLWLGVRR